MISFIVRTDVHVSATAPASRVDDYLGSCLDKLRQIGELAREHEATAVLDNGDFFHLKAPSKNPHAMLHRIIDVHAEYPCPTYANIGNHDVKYGRSDLIEEQPLGVLFASRVFHRMLDHTFEDEDGLKVRLVGFPYKIHFTPEEFDLERGDEDVLVVAAHTYATPKGGEKFGQEIALSYQDLSECSPDVFIFGHLHVDQGIQEVGGKLFFNLGSVMRGSLIEANLDRVPRVGLLRIKKNSDGEISVQSEPIELKVKPSSEVFDLIAHEKRKEEEKTIEDYVRTLKAVLAQPDSENVRTRITDQEGFPEAVKERALQYLE